MSSHDATRLQSLFAAALELPDGVRAAFLEKECAGDQGLLAELRNLLAVDARLAGTTARPIGVELTQLVASTAPQSSLSGLRVGAFELREELGRGGMGSVYRAERVDGSVTQEVAIKFVRRELLDANTRRRFQLERQLMATLDHPNIARLLDASELADGTPYYVMEYVAGVPITDYCARGTLNARECVALMRLVCGAVAEAHRELIVHRDLKPGNILITADGAPKLLDFGIAKPLNASAEAFASEETGTAYRYFSPHYAAPEQLTGAPVGIACDVYALGQLLYELLAGCRPFDFSQLSAGQIERLITEVPPPAPSVALARSTTADTRIRARQLRGDLDGIVLRCLRKAPHERYASVEQLEADLGNYLDGQPVQARGGHRWYRLHKFVRRNTVAVAASLLVAASLIVGIVAFALQARIAQQRAAELEQVSKFQADMLAQVDPTDAGVLLTTDVKAKFEAALVKAGVPEIERAAQVAAFAAQWRRVNATDVARDLIDRTILEPAANAIDQQFKNQPTVDATLRQALASRYLSMSSYELAMPPQQKALATRLRVLGKEHPDTLTSMSYMGLLLKSQGKLVEAEPYLRESLEKRRRVLGEEHPDTLMSIHEMGVLLMLRRKLGEADLHNREAWEKRRRVLGEEHMDTLDTIGSRAMLLQVMGKLGEAEQWYREALEKCRRVLGEDHAETLGALNNLGFLLKARGKLNEAEPYFREALEKRRRVKGEENPQTLLSIANMGDLLLIQGRLSEAEPYYREVLEKRRRVYGQAHPFTIRSTHNVGFLLQSQGKLDEAQHYFRSALEESRRALGEQHASTLKSIMYLGSLQVLQGKHRAAAELFAPAEAAARKAFTGDTTRWLGRFLRGFGKARAGLKEFAAAEASLLEAYDMLAQSPAPRPDDMLDCTQAIVDLYAAWHKAEQGKGLDVKLAQWQRTLEELRAATPSPGVSHSSSAAE